jgi:simple sugar transport system permease protein
MLARLLSGSLDTAAIRLQGVPLPGNGDAPVRFVPASPHILTVVPPKAGGRPYVPALCAGEVRT